MLLRRLLLGFVGSDFLYRLFFAALISALGGRIRFWFFVFDCVGFLGFTINDMNMDMLYL